MLNYKNLRKKEIIIICAINNLPCNKETEAAVKLDLMENHIQCLQLNKLIIMGLR